MKQRDALRAALRQLGDDEEKVERVIQIFNLHMASMANDELTPKEAKRATAKFVRLCRLMREHPALQDYIGRLASREGFGEWSN